MKPNPTSYKQLLTPKGKAAIAVIGVWGQKGIDYVRKSFVPRSRKKSNLYYGFLEHNGQKIDEILLYQEPQHKYLEIHCHGGVAMAEKILSLLPVPTAPPEELPPHYPASDTIQKNALKYIPKIYGIRGVQMLLAQYNGALKKQIQQILMHISKKNWTKSLELFNRLQDTFGYAQKFFSPPQILIAGAPNVGKSSLFNRLISQQRSIVTSTAGTTRNIVKETVFWDGFPLCFMDTAGLRKGADIAEQQGIQQALQQAQKADLILLVFDASSPEPDPFTLELKEQSQSKIKTLAILNKIDISPRPEWKFPELRISCKEQIGLEELKKTLVERTFGKPIEEKNGVLFCPKLAKTLQQAREYLPQNYTKAEEILKTLLH
ncbi:MAG: GTP-binding protein [Planctomycetota bacterium]|nr:MAG: GTP-binding protein [Planctomycetota bacterium]